MRHYWVDDLNPWVFRFSGNLGIRWYGVAYVVGIAFAGYMFSRWAQQKRLPISVEEAHTLLLYAAIGAVLGGRIGYCLFYNFSEVSRHPLEILAIWHGGMASHGGILGLVTAILIFAWKRGVNPLIFLDAAAATGPLGIALGRIANFINGELWGRPTSVPWAVIFPDAPTVSGIAVPRHPSQLYAAGMEGLLVFAVAQWVFRRQQRPGLTTAAVCMAYGLARFADEFWREPDIGQPIFFGWMSKGQLLTLPMVVIAIKMLIGPTPWSDPETEVRAAKTKDPPNGILKPNRRRSGDR